MVHASRLVPLVALVVAALAQPLAAQERGVAAPGSASLASAPRQGFGAALETLAVPASASLAPALLPLRSSLTPVAPGAAGAVAPGLFPGGTTGQGSLEPASSSVSPASGAEKAGARPALEPRRVTGRLIVVERAATDAATFARLEEALALLRAGKAPAATTRDSSRLEVFAVARWRERSPLRLRLVADLAHAADLERLRRSPGATVSLSGVAEALPGAEVLSLRDWRLLALSTDERLTGNEGAKKPSAKAKPAAKPSSKDEEDELLED